MKETKKQLEKNIAIMKKEITELRCKADGYYEIAGSPIYASSPIKDHYAYNKYKKIVNQINSKNKTLNKMYDRLKQL